MATKIPADDSKDTEEFVLRNLKLANLQAHVGGMIEFFHFSDGSALMVNENGRIEEKPLNRRASAITITKRRPEQIVGDAVFFSKQEMGLFETEDEDEGDDGSI